MPALLRYSIRPGREPTSRGKGGWPRDRIFVETKRFHALSLDEKMKLRLNRSNNGYMPLRGHAQRHTTLNKTPPKPNENESRYASRTVVKPP